MLPHAVTSKISTAGHVRACPGLAHWPLKLPLREWGPNTWFIGCTGVHILNGIYRFSHFCRAYRHDQQSEQETHKPRYSVCSNRLHQAIAIQPKNVTIKHFPFINNIQLWSSPQWGPCWQVQLTGGQCLGQSDEMAAVPSSCCTIRTFKQHLKTHMFRHS